MFAKKKLVAAIFGVVATVGWTLQGLGLAFYYRQVMFFTQRHVHFLTPVYQIYAHHTAAGHTMEKVILSLWHEGKKTLTMQSRQRQSWPLKAPKRISPGVESRSQTS
jgi:hypothetical protein